jgi:hypothetical protein
MSERMGRPPRLSHADEFELYCYRKSGVSIKTCASMWRVSVPTANRIIAKFRGHDAQMEPLRALRESMNALMPRPAVESKPPREPRKTSPERRVARFWAKVTRVNVRGCCWLWSGYAQPSGHGLTSWNSRPINAHRLAWILKRGIIEGDLCVNHKCHNPLCCNPEHMYLGTRAQNCNDRWGKTRYYVRTDTVSSDAELVSD